MNEPIRKVLVELGQYIADGLMDLKCPSLVCDGHMTWYIAKNIQNKLFKCILMAFSRIFKISWTISGFGHFGHMTWYILNISGTLPSQDIAVTSI